MARKKQENWNYNRPPFAFYGLNEPYQTQYDYYQYYNHFNPTACFHNNVAIFPGLPPQSSGVHKRYRNPLVSSGVQNTGNYHTSHNDPKPSSWTDQYWQRHDETATALQGPQNTGQNSKNPCNKVEKTLNKMLAQPPEMSKGKSLLEKMGWKGGGLGKDGDGIVEPIAPKATYATQTIGLGLLAEQQEQEQERTKPKSETKVKRRRSADRNNPKPSSWTDQYWQKHDETATASQGPRTTVENSRIPCNKVEKTLNKMLAQPPEMSKGKSLLEKMGWKGGGLGKDGEGIVEPIAPKATYATQTIGLGLLAEQEEQIQQQTKPKRQPRVKMRRSAEWKRENKLKQKMNKQPRLKKLKKLAELNELGARDDDLQFNSYFQTNILLRIQEFVKNNTQSQLLFEENLTRFERRKVHMIVENIRQCEDPYHFVFVEASEIELVEDIMAHNHYVLYTESHGTGESRRLSIFKEAPEDVYLITPDDLKNDINIREELNNINDSQSINKKRKQVADKKIVGTSNSKKKSIKHKNKLREEVKIEIFEIKLNDENEDKNSEINNKNIVISDKTSNNDESTEHNDCKTNEINTSELISSGRNENSQQNEKYNYDNDKYEIIINNEAENDSKTDEINTSKLKSCGCIESNENSLQNEKYNNDNDKSEIIINNEAENESKTNEINTSEFKSSGNHDNNGNSLQNEKYNNDDDKSEITNSNEAEITLNLNITYDMKESNEDTKSEADSVNINIKENIKEDQELNSSLYNTDTNETIISQANKIKIKEKGESNIMAKLIDYLQEFVDNEVYVEFRFLGLFNEKEYDTIQLFFDICSEKEIIDENEEKNQIKQILNHGLYNFDVREDSNGSYVIFKTDKNPKPPVVFHEDI